MKLFLELFILVFILFVIGCNDSSSPIESIKIDEHKTQLIYFMSNGIQFSTNKAVVNISPGDTLNNKVTVVDSDKLARCEVFYNNRFIIGMVPKSPIDTMSVEFGMVVDTSLSKIGSKYIQEAVFNDTYGFETKVEIQINIIAKH